MSWFQVKKLQYPISRRSCLKAVVPQTQTIFTISHKAIESEGISYAFETPLDRSTMSTQLELDRNQIRINYVKEGKQKHFLINSKGLFDRTECLNSFSNPSLQQTPLEVLDLGSHKRIDIDAGGRNTPLDQLLPAWFSLGQLPGTTQILELNDLKEYYLDHFEDLFSFKTPMALQTGYHSIRSYFFTSDSQILNFLPALPKGLDSGKMRLFANDLTITLEWSKREVKRIVMQAHQEGVWKLDFGKKFQSMQKRKDHKMQSAQKVCADTISLKKGEYAFLDQFRR
ncbi:MAG: hypothetical protein FJZ62_03525 [Chlamydiae bacterium]|nr:hypothetical protein [Chlamydiota bacterium]